MSLFSNSIHRQTLTNIAFLYTTALNASQPLELLKTRFQLNEGKPMRILPAVRGESPHRPPNAAVQPGGRSCSAAVAVQPH
jgi:hypothetical protein